MMYSRHSNRSPTLFRVSELRQAWMMVFLLLVLGSAFVWARDPGNWQWLVAERSGSEEPENPAAANAAASRERPATAEAAPVSGPTDEDPEEITAIREPLEAITDRRPLGPEEMPAYWRLMKWSRNQTFRAMRQRARSDLLYTQLWEQPEKYRGKLVRLRLHLQRALSHEAPENSAGIKTVYEAWGWTDESKLPYIIVFSNLPAGFPLRDGIRENAEFVGYFLKIMAYQAHDQERAAPLLIGRLQWRFNSAEKALGADQSGLFWLTLLLGGTFLLIVIGAWIFARRRSAARNASPPTLADDAAYQQWLHDVEQTPPPESL